MKKIGISRASPKRVGYFLLIASPIVAGAITLAVVTQPAIAADAPVNLGTAASFAVLGGSGDPGVTNTGASIINGDLGVWPDNVVTGFPPGIVTPPGQQHVADAVAKQAQSDLTTAYNDAAGRTPAATVAAIGVRTLGPGVYNATSALHINGSLTLNAGGDPNAVFIFQVGSALITASSSSIILTNGAMACNVFWQVGSSATLGSNSTFVGTIMALTSITVGAGVDVMGRLLARNGDVTLITDTVTPSTCSPTVTPTVTPTPTATVTRPAPSPSPTVTTPAPSPTLTVTGPAPSPSLTVTGPAPSPSLTVTTPAPSPSPTLTRPAPSPTGTIPTPTATFTRPAPSPTGTSPTSRPKPKPKSRPKPAPAPRPVGTTFPVTG